MVTTIQIDEKTKAILDKLKVHYRQSYNEVIMNMAEEKTDKKTDLSKLFGSLPRLRKWSTQELKDEARRGWLSDSDREREAEWEKKEKSK